MEFRIADVDGNSAVDLLGCRGCVYWEYPEHFDGSFSEETARLKREWFESMTQRFGVCGKVLYVNDESAAYCQYALPGLAPGISRYKGLAPYIEDGGVLITCLYVFEGYQRKGLGRELLGKVVDELRKRGFPAVQTISRNDSDNNCSGPTCFYLTQGFSVVATEEYSTGDSFSLVRLELV